jgi:molybdopterin-guanine dinucleotide biosynthesis protein B
MSSSIGLGRAAAFAAARAGGGVPQLSLRRERCRIAAAPVAERPAHYNATAMRVFGFAGWSGSGKTTLIEQVVPHLVAGGVRVSLIKHAHHSFDIDRPGKDSYRHRAAGCMEVLVTSRERWALMHELRGGREMTLAETLARLSPCDLVLVEGYKAAPIPKLEIWRPAAGKPLLFPRDPHIIAIATDSPDALPANPGGTPLRRFTLEQTGEIATLVLSAACSHLPRD